MESLEPRRLWHFFEAITKVPRPSKKEEKIIAYLEEFAKERGLTYKKDHVGNIIMKKPATKGYEDRQAICLQSHVDMVCEKNSDVDFNFETDAIQTEVVDGWLTAKGTTLGADNGIGVAAELAILDAQDMEHGPLECLFTIDEETGLTGAMELREGFVDSPILINLDSEEEGELFVGCAGGASTVALFDYLKLYAEPQLIYCKVEVSGLRGGHSGADIHVGLGNANKLLARFLYGLDTYTPDWVLAKISGGNLHNAIPREAEAVIGIPSEFKEQIAVYANEFSADIAHELKSVDPDVKLSLQSTSKPEYIIDHATKEYLVSALLACPHGVLGMSHDIEGLVETSNNLASVKMLEDKSQIRVETSQRSSSESLKIAASSTVRAVFELAEAEVEECDGYPGWEPDMDSAILKVTKAAYEKVFHKSPEIKAIHAGLECGLFKKKYPHLDMISFGPTMRDVHSPNERVEIKTVEMWWNHLVELLKMAPKAE